MRLPLWLKLGWTLWVVAWAPFYWKQYGAQNFLYFCDLGNFFIAIALWTESALLFSWQATGLLLFQALFTLDLLPALLFGKHFIGGEVGVTLTLPTDGYSIDAKQLILFHPPDVQHLNRFVAGNQPCRCSSGC